MKDNVEFNCIGNGMREMTIEEVACVSGADAASAKVAAGLAVGIGTVTWGSSFGAMAVGAAFASAPFAAIVVVGLIGYAGYTYFRPPIMAR